MCNELCHAKSESTFAVQDPAVARIRLEVGKQHDSSMVRSIVPLVEKFDRHFASERPH